MRSVALSRARRWRVVAQVLSGVARVKLADFQGAASDAADLSPQAHRADGQHRDDRWAYLAPEVAWRKRRAATASLPSPLSERSDLGDRILCDVGETEHLLDPAASHSVRPRTEPIENSRDVQQA
jgi:hypothetical protein